MKKISITAIFLTATFLISGCSLGSDVIKKTMPTDLISKATFLKTVDGGVAWELKMKIDEKKNISSVNVLSVAIDPFDDNILYLGSEKDGIFVSKDKAETWSQIKFPEKVYGLVVDYSTKNVLYASGVYNGRGKIFKKIGEGTEWKEIYTEPADGTVISALAMDKFNSNIIYAGTSEGVIIKTTDGGGTWNNLHKADAAVTSIAFDSSSSGTVYFGIFRRNLLRTFDGGIKIENIMDNISDMNGNQNIYSVVADPYFSGVVYVGMGTGIAKSLDKGETWTTLNIIASSSNFPIRVMAINPKNSKEIIYVSGKAIYKSIDGGLQWSTYQLDTNKDVSRIVYDKNNPSVLYAGLRNY